MAGLRDAGDIEDAERRILRLLCQDSAERERLSGYLMHYRWKHLGHRAIFEIVSGLRQLSAEKLRILLPTRLTNAGFPDFPWESMFQSCDISSEEAETLIQQLVTRRD